MSRVTRGKFVFTINGAVGKGKCHFGVACVSYETLKRLKYHIVIQNLFLEACWNIIPLSV